MDAEDYKRTATYGVFREDQLKETLQILKSQNAKEASVIEEAFHKGGLGIPITRDGVDEYPYYVVNCTEDEAYEILDRLFEETTLHIYDIWVSCR
jgi:hypothetical protein